MGHFSAVVRFQCCEIHPEEEELYGGWLRTKKCIVMDMELMFRSGSCDLFSNVMVGRILHALSHKMHLCLLQGQLFRNIMGMYLLDCMASLTCAVYLDMDDYISRPNPAKCVLFCSIILKTYYLLKHV